VPSSALPPAISTLFNYINTLDRRYLPARRQVVNETAQLHRQHSRRDYGVAAFTSTWALANFINSGQSSHGNHQGFHGSSSWHAVALRTLITDS
jgi:hypothetical protein